MNSTKARIIEGLNRQGGRSSLVKNKRGLNNQGVKFCLIFIDIKKPKIMGKMVVFKLFKILDCKIDNKDLTYFSFCILIRQLKNEAQKVRF